MASVKPYIAACMKHKQDRNFDKLIDKFAEKIYSTDKGHWRLKLLREDLQFLQQQQNLQIWDAGCGFAQISQWLAENGHQLVLCDISKKMLAQAQQNFKDAGLQAQFHHQSAQNLAPQLPDFDLVVFHAVLEWLADPVPSLLKVARKVKPQGYLSLLFYNRNAMVFSNALKGSWRIEHLLNDSYLGKGKKLTPPNPQYPHDIIETLGNAGFSVIKQTGIRIFHDYLPADALEKTDKQALFDLEYRYCRKPTYNAMGRYIHLLLQKS